MVPLRDDHSTKHKAALFFLSFLPIGAFLRFHHIGLRTFWLDEAAVTNLTRYNFSDLWSQSAIQDSSPAYIYLIKIWVGEFGNSEFSVRTVSAIFGLLSIVAIYFLGKFLFGRKVGLWASFLLAVNYFSLFYSIQARPYAMAIFLSILPFYFFAKLLENPRSILNAVLYVAITVVGVYTHIWFFLLLGSQMLWWLWNYFSKKYGMIFVFYFFLIGAFSLPWVMALLRFGNNRGIESYGAPGLGAFWETFHYFMFGGVWIFFVVSLIALASFFVGLKKEEGGGTVRYRLIERKNTDKPSSGNYFLLVCLFAPLAVAWIFSQFAPIYVTGRHEAVVLPAFLLLVANLWSGIGNKKLMAVIGAVLVLVAFQSVGAEKQTIQSYTSDDRTVAESLLGKIHAGDFVVFTDLSRPTFDYYLPKLNLENKKFREISYPPELEIHPAYEVVGAMLEDKGKLEGEADKIVSEAKNIRPENIWVISFSGNPVNKILKSRFDLNFNLAGTEKMDAGASPMHYNEILKYQLKDI